MLLFSTQFEFVHQRNKMVVHGILCVCEGVDTSLNNGGAAE